MIPAPWEATLLALAAYRVWALLAEDSILDRPRVRLFAWRGEQAWVGEFVTCPWCFGFWVAVAWWAAWCAWPDSLVAAVPFALSTAVGVLAGVVSRLADDG